MLLKKPEKICILVHSNIGPHFILRKFFRRSAKKAILVRFAKFRKLVTTRYLHLFIKLDCKIMDHLKMFPLL